MIEIEGPDGQLHTFPDGTPDEAIVADMRSRYTRTVPEKVGRAVGLTGRYLLEGAGEGVGVFTDPFAKMLGAVVAPETPVRGLGRNASRLAEVLGLPAPETEREQQVAGVSRGVVGAAAPAGLAGKLAGATSGVGSKLMQFLAEAPGQQMAAGGGSAAATEWAKAQGYSPEDQALFGLAGGLGAGVALPHAGMASYDVMRAGPQVLSDQYLKDVGLAGREGVRLLTTDVHAPTTKTGQFAQWLGEKVPLLGTGGLRAAQQQERTDAVARLMGHFDADNPHAAATSVSADLAAQRSAELTKYKGMKTDVIERLSQSGAPVPTPRTLTKIRGLIAQSSKHPALQPLVVQLKTLENTLSGTLTLKEMEKERELLGELYKAPELGGVSTASQKALNSLYAPLREDMGAFIRAAGGARDATKWSIANRRLTLLADDLKSASFRTALNKGEATPEVVERVLFNAHPSEVHRLARSLTPTGRESARSAMLARVAEKATVNIDGTPTVNPDMFLKELGKLDAPRKAFFQGAEAEYLDGVERVLNMTRRAGAATKAQGGPDARGSSMLLGALVGYIGRAGLMSAGALGAGARAYEHRLVRDVKEAVRGISKTRQGTKEEREAATRVVMATQALTAAQRTQSEEQ